MSPAVSVVMPTYGHDSFISRAVGSLLAQDVADWELLVVDDGSPDRTVDVVTPFLGDERIRYERLATNRGVGAAANRGLDLATAPLVAYLPSDDRWHPDHLAAVLGVLADDDVALAWSGVVHHGDQRSEHAPPGEPLQLVQVAHRRTDDRWVERHELESDDLEALLWAALRRRGRAVGTGRVTCEWTDHPAQRHKAIRERHDGGLNVFRRRYRISAPLRFRSSDGWLIDEAATYRNLDHRPAPSADGLRILLVGELAFNPERILALEERAHRLFGLWTDDGLGTHTVGPLPFGNVVDVPTSGWREALRDLRPDVIYALLNWRAVPLAADVLRASGTTPFVWHFKESPMRCMRQGTWPALVELVTGADLCVMSSPEELAWFHDALPGRIEPRRTLVLDGDLPKAEWVDGDRSPRRGDGGEVHTVVVGRPLGIDAAVAGRLADADIHLHLHGAVRAPGITGAWATWIDDAVAAAPHHVHVHPHVAQHEWRRVLSRYDAGWLHRTSSDNDGDIGRATWDDLNIPARLPVYLAAGVPVLQQAAPGAVVAAQRLVGEEHFGLLYRDVDHLCELLHDRTRLRGAADAADRARHRYTFDHHVDDLLSRFRTLTGGP